MTRVHCAPGLIAAALLSGSPLAAQEFPQQAVHLQVAFAPGGPADIIARVIGQKLNERWKEPVVVENRGGAGGNIAAAAVAKADPNGYTILVSTSAYAVNETLSKTPGYAPTDLRAAVIVATTPNLIIGAPTLEAKTLKDVIEAARKQPMTYGTAGVGTTPHLSAERIFRLEAKVDIPHAPFTGAGPAMQAVAGSHIALASIAMSAGVGNVKAGQVKGLAVTSRERVPALPDVPTTRELGLGDTEDSTWVAFFVPAKTPEAVIEKINADVNAVLKDKTTVEQLDKIGFMPVGGSRTEAQTYVAAEVRKWGTIIKTIGLEPN
jgi:tripartite-type tricarboxylate transporter receptor subunit TctC